MRCRQTHSPTGSRKSRRSDTSPSVRTLLTSPAPWEPRYSFSLPLSLSLSPSFSRSLPHSHSLSLSCSLSRSFSPSRSRPLLPPCCPPPPPLFLSKSPKGVAEGSRARERGAFCTPRLESLPLILATYDFLALTINSINTCHKCELYFSFSVFRCLSRSLVHSLNHSLSLSRSLSRCLCALSHTHPFCPSLFSQASGAVRAGAGSSAAAASRAFAAETAAAVRRAPPPAASASRAPPPSLGGGGRGAGPATASRPRR